MTERIAGLRKYFITQRGHRALRKAKKDPFLLASGFALDSEKDTVRAVKRLIWMLNEETPVIVPGQKILFMRTNPTLQALFTEEEKRDLESRYRLHELGELSNICVDYTHLLSAGFPGMLQKLEAQRKLFTKQEQKDYADGQLSILRALLDLIARYCTAASDAGNQEGAESLTRLISDKPRSFRDALQMQRIIHFTMWCSGNYHNTLGRFDQYMMPYMVILLSTFYRTALNKGKDITTLENELQNIRAYIQIQLLSYSETISVTYDIAPSLSLASFPNFILQPLVENALDHGLKNSLRPDKRLHIAVKREPGNLSKKNAVNILIEIEDNGIGMDQETVASLFQIETNGYGMRNVNDRLRLLYADRYSLEVHSQPGAGTRTVLRLPV